MSKRALITGITGQDGSYLAELLLTKGYTVYGVIRRSSTFNTQRIDHIYQDPHATDRRLLLIYGDLADSSAINAAIQEAQPDEVYNLGAQSHVRVSFDIPEYTADVAGLGAVRVLEAIRKHRPQCRYYQASSSELYGKVREIPQRETTPFHPRSPYACAKAYAYYITLHYREAYDMFACNGILFNHESPRRGETFVTRKITRAVARIHHGVQDCLYLGNLESKRDWGFAGDYVEAMWLMLQQDLAKDYVIATGKTYSVREFVEASFRYAGHSIEWRGQGVEEVGIDAGTGKVVIRIDTRYFRPAEVDLLLGDASLAEQDLGWKPQVDFAGLVKLMVDADMELVHKMIHGSSERVDGREMH